MNRVHHGHSAAHLDRREPEALPLDDLLDSSVIQRSNISKRNPSDDSSTTSPSTCGKNDNSPQCGKPADTNNITLPVVLGVVIPLVAAIVVFFFLHRRHVKRLRQEDANDPHKSLDFGIDPTLSTSGKKKSKKDDADSSVIDMSTEKALRREHGMSMDMGSPYLLPPGLQGSRESLHSLSRTIHSGDDRYKPATTIVSTDSTSVRSYPNTQRDIDESPSTADSSAQVYGHDSMNQNLLQNAQRMSRSIPPNSRQLTASNTVSNDQFVEAKPKPSPSEGLNPPSGGLLNISSTIPPDTRGSFMSNTGVDLHKSNNYLGPLIHSGEASDDFKPQHPGQSPMMSPQAPLTEAMQGLNGRKSPPAANFTSTISRPPRLESLNPSKELKYTEIFVHDQGDYEESFNLTPPPPKDDAITRRTETVRQPDPKNVPSTDGYVSGGMEASAIGFDARRLSMGVRPLPPDDPTDNPEQRANRIRSFYKEYFDDSKPAPVRGPADYVEDYDQTFLGDGAIFDPASGQFVIAQPQFAEPYARRAMTPPPRAPPRFQGPARHHATTSNGGFVPRGQRAFSSVSGRLGPPGRGPLRAPLPPPSPLRVLPSPHLMKEDSFALPIDFAPPMSYKDRQAGRPESPRGGMRPYSPMTPAHLPLASSFDDLSVMPSPHSLRKSGTFTALDFAPPPRFKSSDTASDAGSIRSNRSAMSAQQLHSIRAGAYRVSRIPKEVVGTKNELHDSLKPQWGMRAQ